jgi:hypothetical protein
MVAFRWGEPGVVAASIYKNHATIAVDQCPFNSTTYATAIQSDHLATAE